MTTKVTSADTPNVLSKFALELEPKLFPNDIFDGMPPSTGSPRGPSTLTYEHTCGRQAMYYAALKLHPEQAQAASVSPAGEEKLNPLVVGSCFHWLALNRPAAEDCKTKKTWTPEQVEGARVYRAAVEHDYFGGFKVLQAEMLFEVGTPDTPEYFTGQADAIGEVTDERFGLEVGTKVCLDWKTSGKRRPRGYYCDSAQAHVYFSALKARHNIEAMIFIEIAKVIKIEPKNIQRHVFTGPAWPIAAIKEWAVEAHRLKTAGTRNIASCRGGEYGPPCPFFIQCYGEFHEVK